MIDTITENTETLTAPFPWAGGKRKVAPIVWPRFGDTLNYVEPFAGSLAMLLARPYTVRTETVNDADNYLANFWRATAAAPEEVAHYADWPVNEIDLHARHRWLVSQAEFRERMIADPEYYDAKIAGWWVWGLSSWIGSGWCDVSKINPVQVPYLSGTAQGINTRNGSPRPNLRPAQGVNGLSQQIPEIKGGGQGKGIAADYVANDIYSYIAALAARLRRVRVCCGDWSRIMGPSPTYKIGMTAVFLDPPYSGEMRDKNLYSVDSHTVAEDVRAWCIEPTRDSFTGWSGRRFEHPQLRIALCGYDGEHNELSDVYGWDCVTWKANGGYANQRKNGTNDNAALERIWFSPNCLDVAPKHRQMGFAL